MGASTELATAPGQWALAGAEGGPVSTIVHAMEELKAIRTFVANEMKAEHDYGIIPGTGKKPTLYLPGAQKIAMLYNTAFKYRYKRVELGNGHLECVVIATLVSRHSGIEASSGLGSCSSMEAKYRWRNAERVCPKCQAKAIRKGSKLYGGGWYCDRKKDGCGAKFADSSPEIVGQDDGRAENPDIHDVRNTVLKMAKKRAQVDAAMSLGCVSELFSQDIEDVFDLTTYEVEPEPPPPPQNNTDYGRGQYASPADVEEYRYRCKEFVYDRNQEWLDELTGPHGLPEEAKEYLRAEQVTHHMLKWGLKKGLLADVGVTFDPNTGKPTEAVSTSKAEKYVAILWHRHQEAFIAEAWHYVGDQLEAARAKWREKHGKDEEIIRNEGGRE
jgi:hypothetical protein